MTGLSIYRKEKLNRNTHNTVLIPCQIHATDTEDDRGNAEVHPHFGVAEQPRLGHCMKDLWGMRGIQKQINGKTHHRKTME